VAAVGVRFDHTGDRFAERQLMHCWSPASAGREAHEHFSTPESRLS
jgi:hypothetical protein